MPMPGTFDATQIEPSQGGEAHPIGKFQAVITNTQIVGNKNKDGGMLRLTYQTQAGQIDDNFNLWFDNPDEGKNKAMQIAQKQLSAVCHATGVFKLDWANDGAALRGAKMMIEVSPQVDRTTKQPNGYVEVKKVFDVNGNEPGKAPAQPQTMVQQPGGGWGGGQQPNAPQAQPQPQQPAGWGAPQPNPTPQPTQPQGGWSQQQPQGGGVTTPPWRG